MTGSIMLTATQARSKAQNDIIIFNEVRSIELEILNAIAAGNYQVEVKGTTMTAEVGIPPALATARAYFNSWQGLVSDRAKDQQMAAIITYFTNLGYNIERRTNANTGDTFKWLVLW